MSHRIPFNRPCVAGRETENIAAAIAAGRTSGDGPFTKQCQALLERRFGAARALLTTSCTSALEMAALLCDLGPGDEVILPSYTFVSTANAFVLRGAQPVFVDIRPDTLNLDERRVEQAVTDRTRVICPVHYAGVACEMDTILDIARRHGLRVVEDAAQGVNASYRGRWLGTLGDLGCFSFHETKNFSSGEGGALLVNDAALERRAEIVREKGTNRSQFLRGQVDKYSWVDVGSSYVPSDLLAAFLLGQLEQMERITQRREAIYRRYEAQLAPLAQDGRLVLPTIPAECRSNYHMFYVLTADIEERTALIAHLGRAGIQAVFHYVPLHSSVVGARLGTASTHLPVTDRVSAGLVRLPMFYDLTDSEVDEVCEAVTGFFRGGSRLSA